MAKKSDRRRAQAPTANAIKDPDEWTTGDEPLTGVKAN